LFTAGYKWNSGTGEVQPYRTEYLGLDHAMGRDKKKGISCYRDGEASTSMSIPGFASKAAS
jgi:hypothetical protein